MKSRKELKIVASITNQTLLGERVRDFPVYMKSIVSFSLF